MCRGRNHDELHVGATPTLRCAADASAKELAASTADAARMLDRIRVRLASQKALLAELRDPAHPRAAALRALLPDAARAARSPVFACGSNSGPCPPPRWSAKCQGQAPLAGLSAECAKR